MVRDVRSADGGVGMHAWDGRRRRWHNYLAPYVFRRVQVADDESLAEFVFWGSVM
jgi:hypothetical protein